MATTDSSLMFSKTFSPFRVKLANPAPAAPLTPMTPEEIAYRDSRTIPGSNALAMRDIATLGLTGLAAGAGGRSLMELLRGYTTSKEPKEPVAGPTPIVVRMNRPKPRLTKRALDSTDIRSGVDTAKNWLAGNTHDGQGGLTGLAAKPYYLPGLTAAAIGGLYAGNRFVGGLVDRDKEEQRKKRMQDARNVYQKALLSQFAAGEPEAKTASTNWVKDLDQLASYIVKQAEARQPGITKCASGWLNNALGTGVGSYAAVGGGLMGLSGLATYNYFKDKNPKKRIADAIKARDRLRWATKPPEILFMHDDEDKLPKLKNNEKVADIANLYKS